MSTQAATASSQHAGNSLPLRFKQHSFEAYCYNTQDCSVVYNGDELTRYAAGKASPPPPSTDYRERTWGGAPVIGIRNFPPPAQVSWTSKDGAAHEAAVDIGSIFKDELVLHQVPDGEIPDGTFNGPAGEPEIVLEVNDRTISVYMKMFIPTKSAQIAGNPNSFFRDDIVKAWSKTY